MVKFVRFHELGGPEVLRVEEEERREPGSGEVLLRIEAVALNRAEMAQRGGHYIVKPELPARIGSESTATILKVGPDVEGYAEGDLVSTMPMQVKGVYGAYATETLWPASNLAKLPEGTDPVQSAATWMAFFTAWGGLIETAKLQPGEPVVITAGSSSVGLAAIQVAKEAGAVVIGTTRKSDKAQALRDAGADHVIATDEVDIVAEVNRITDGQGVRIIFDPVAGPFAETLFECLAIEGVLMIYGGMANKPATFPRHLAIRKNLTMRGYNFHPMMADPARRQAARAAIMKGLQAGRFKMPVAQVFSLDQIVEAHRTMERNEHVGKIVVKPE